MRVLLTKPDALGDQLIVAPLVAAWLRQRPELRLVWHVKCGSEAVAPLLGAPVFRPDTQASPPAEAQRLLALPDRLVFLPYPLFPHETWRPDVRRRLAWWVEFLRATRWDAVVAPVVNRTWVVDVTVSVAPATARHGFTALAARQTPTNEAHGLVPADGPPFTHVVEASFTRAEFDQLRELLATAEPRLASEVTSPDWALGRSRLPGPTEPWALLAPGVGGDSRRVWPLERFLSLADALRAKGLRVGWIEGPGDARFYGGPLPPADERFNFDADSLTDLAATFRDARLVVCQDTAYAHLASALGVTTLAVYGAGQDARFFPRGARVKVVQGQIPCAGCQWYCLFDRNVCITDVPAAVVIQAAFELLDRADLAPVFVPLSTPLADAPEGEGVALRRRLQERVVFLEADRFARLQIIQGLLAPAAEPAAPRDAPPGPSAAEVAPAAPPGGTVRISVVIPMGRPERVAGTLRSLEAQRPRPENWEIIVAGRQAGTVPAQFPHLPIVPVELADRLPPSATRCRGVERATGAWLLFVDDDVELAPDFVARLRELLESEPFQPAPGRGAVVAVGPRLPGKSRRFFGHLTDRSNFWAQQTRIAEDRTWLFSATVAVRADAYREVGGFNPELVIGEDVDLTNRLVHRGHRLRFEPSLVAWHDHQRDSLPRMWRYFWQNGTAPEFFFAHFQVACCFSIKTVFIRAWRDLQMNRDFMHRNGERLGALAPWVYVNYLILELSWEFHYQRLLRRDRRYAARATPAPSDRTYVRAMEHYARRETVRGTLRYAWAMLQDFGNPVRR